MMLNDLKIIWNCNVSCCYTKTILVGSQSRCFKPFPFGGLAFLFVQVPAVSFFEDVFLFFSDPQRNDPKNHKELFQWIN